MGDLPWADVVSVGFAQLHQVWKHLFGLDLAVQEITGQVHQFRAVAALGQHFWGIFLRPPAVAAGIDQHQMRQSVRVAQRILERDITAERMPQHRPLFVSQFLSQGVGIGSQVFPVQARELRPLGTPITAVVIEDQRELICQRFE